MPRKYLAFDLETAKILPEDFGGDLMAHRPLGIACAATWATGVGNARLFYSQEPEGSPSPKMHREDLSALVDDLLEQIDAGYTLVTWNGLGFDFDILAEESGRLDDCRRLAREHVDMMFHIFCQKGFPVGLNAAAQAIGLAKPKGVDGAVAPELWRDGEYETVLDYVARDCELTLALAEQSEAAQHFRWITRRGTTSRLRLDGLWLTVAEALQLPEPDTSWMDDPWSRSKFTAWLD